MRKHNTKKREYKEWLKLNDEYYESWWQDELFMISKETAELRKRLNDPKFLKYQRFYNNPPKWYVKTFHRSDRKYNKQALKVNIQMMGEPYDEHPSEFDDNWIGISKTWGSEYVNYRYNHRNTAKWWYW